MIRPTWMDGEPEILEIRPEAHTYAGFLEWVLSDKFPEKLPVTFVDGKILLNLEEETLDSHVGVKGSIYCTLLPVTREVDFGEFYSSGVLYCNEAAQLVTNPDALAMRWETLDSGRAGFITVRGDEQAVKGAPDGILEVVDDSTQERDTKELRAAYHRARIAEYWLIDARGKEISFQVLAWQQSGYAAASPQEGGWVRSKVFGRDFRLTRSRNRRGAWVYTLETRAAN